MCAVRNVDLLIGNIVNIYARRGMATGKCFFGAELRGGICRVLVFSGLLVALDISWIPPVTPT